MTFFTDFGRYLLMLKGMFSKPENFKMKIFPNPVQDVLVILLPAKNSNGEVTVYNIEGEVMLKASVENKQARKEIGTSQLVPGTYIIQFKTTNGKVTAREKFVKL